MQTTHEITPRSPFDFAHTLDFVCGFSPMAGEQEVHAARLRKAHEIGGRAVLVDVEPGAAGALRVRLTADGELVASVRAAALDRVRFTLSLDDDLAPFYAIAARDPAFSPIVRAQHGHHHVKFPSPFEITAWAVLTQRSPIRVARRVKQKVIERFGASIEVDGERHAAFPSAERVAALSDAELGAVVKNPIKTSAIRAIARAFLDVDERWLRTAPFDDVRAFLSGLPRIGPWSTAFVLFRGLGRMPRLELTDGPIFDCARHVYGARADVLTEAARYGEHVGMWSLYLRWAGRGLRPASRTRAA
ncbi:MAG TPA: hypothetical protein VHB21_01895 [Minicystis sp.]|nr:hypothetical protein [Minicystis sp.]